MIIMPGKVATITTGGDIAADGFTRLLGGSGGRVHIRASGDFVGASIQLGFLNSAQDTFYPYTDKDGVEVAAFTGSFTVDAAIGNDSLGAINLSGFTGTTNIEITVTELS